MEYLPNGVTLQLCDGAFPLSTDSVLLAHFVKLRKNARVLDLGSGCATLGLMLCARDEGCAVTGLELSEDAHAAAEENIRRNGLEERLNSICADLRDLPPDFTGHFHCCVSNPPYFSGGPASTATPLARRDDCCSPAELCCTAGLDDASRFSPEGVKLESSDESVAVIRGSRVEAVGPGICTIRATLELGGVSRESSLPLLVRAD